MTRFLPACIVPKIRRARAEGSSPTRGGGGEAWGRRQGYLVEVVSWGEERVLVPRRGREGGEGGTRGGFEKGGGNGLRKRVGRGEGGEERGWGGNRWGEDKRGREERGGGGGRGGGGKGGGRGGGGGGGEGGGVGRGGEGEGGGRSMDLITSQPRSFSPCAPDSSAQCTQQ